jgi:hypothetical protein
VRRVLADVRAYHHLDAAAAAALCLLNVNDPRIVDREPSTSKEPPARRRTKKSSRRDNRPGRSFSALGETHAHSAPRGVQ